MRLPFALGGLHTGNCDSNFRIHLKEGDHVWGVTENGTDICRLGPQWLLWAFAGLDVVETKETMWLLAGASISAQ